MPLDQQRKGRENEVQINQIYHLLLCGAGLLKRRQSERRQREAAQQGQAQMQRYNKAKSACLKGRGYTVE
ncbi:MAG: hypothetical protein KAH64_05645 [Nitrosomonadaceae bacterium]|nr:hypothetical protein [Nitrosomonadaceae bacterium]